MNWEGGKTISPQYKHVVVPGRNWTLFCCAIVTTFEETSAIGGAHTCCVNSWILNWHIYTARMSPTLNGSSALQCFKRGNVIEMCNRIMFDFSPGLTHIQFSYSTHYLTLENFSLVVAKERKYYHTYHTSLHTHTCAVYVCIKIHDSCSSPLV